MDEPDRKRLLVAVAISAAAAIAAGGLLGLAAGAWKVGFRWLALPVGLTAGLSLRALGAHRHRAALPAALLCVGMALAAHVVTCRLAEPKWVARNRIRNEELDGLAQRILALRTCHERKIMGVWEYEDVPQAIKDQAAGRLAGMSEKDKLALCDQTFGERMNRTADRAGGGYLGPVVWGVLTVVAAVGPVVARERER